jgi:hypothetical protein
LSDSREPNGDHSSIELEFARRLSCWKADGI